MELDDMKWKISRMCPQEKKTSGLTDRFPTNLQKSDNVGIF